MKWDVIIATAVIIAAIGTCAVSFFIDDVPCDFNHEGFHRVRGSNLDHRVEECRCRDVKKHLEVCEWYALER